MQLRAGRSKWTAGAEALDGADGPRGNFPRWLRFVERNDENANDKRTHARSKTEARVRL